MDRASAARRNMVDSQIRVNDVTRPDIVRAFLEVPREAFVPLARESVAYSEIEIETSPGRALWTARDFAKLLNAMEPAPGDIALVIGAGAGYECAVLNDLVQSVIGLEGDEAVSLAAGDRLSRLGYDHVACVSGPLAEGLAGEAPFDLILVNGMVETLPEAWLEQLGEGGRLGVVVAEAGVGRARVYTKAGGVASFRTVFDASPPRFAEFDRRAAFSF